MVPFMALLPIPPFWNLYFKRVYKVLVLLKVIDVVNQFKSNDCARAVTDSTI